MLYCTVLYCIVLCCTVLYCVVLYCTVLYCSVLYCIVLYCTVQYYHLPLEMEWGVRIARSASRSCAGNNCTHESLSQFWSFYFDHDMLNISAANKMGKCFLFIRNGVLFKLCLCYLYVYCVLLDCESLIRVDFIHVFAIPVWHPRFPLNGIKK